MASQVRLYVPTYMRCRKRPTQLGTDPNLGQNPFDLTRRRLLLCAHTGQPPIVIGEETIDGAFASWAHFPSDWSSVELPVVDAVPYMADAELKNKDAVKGSIMLVSRGAGPFVGKVKRASAAGAAAVIVFNTEDKLMEMGGGDDEFTSDIPVIMIKSSDAPRLREHGSALLRYNPVTKQRGPCQVDQHQSPIQ